jgi:hypothetical protein
VHFGPKLVYIVIEVTNYDVWFGLRGKCGKGAADQIQGFELALGGIEGHKDESE